MNGNIVEMFEVLDILWEGLHEAESERNRGDMISKDEKKRGRWNIQLEKIEDQKRYIEEQEDKIKARLGIKKDIKETEETLQSQIDKLDKKINRIKRNFEGHEHSKKNNKPLLEI